MNQPCTDWSPSPCQACQRRLQSVVRTEARVLAIEDDLLTVGQGIGSHNRPQSCRPTIVDCENPFLVATPTPLPLNRLRKPLIVNKNPEPNLQRSTFNVQLSPNRFVEGCAFWVPGSPFSVPGSRLGVGR